MADTVKVWKGRDYLFDENDDVVGPAYALPHEVCFVCKQHKPNMIVESGIPPTFNWLCSEHSN